MITEENIEYKHYRAKLGFERFPKYVKHFKAMFPNYDLHHILGSEGKLKHTDALLFPYTHEFHLNVVHKNPAKYFKLNLAGSVFYFEHYICNVLGGIIPLGLTNTPEDIQTRIDLATKLNGE